MDIVNEVVVMTTAHLSGGEREIRALAGLWQKGHIRSTVVSLMEFCAIKITGFMGKIGLVAEHSKPVQSRK
jgi:hypothetical protein